MQNAEVLSSVQKGDSAVLLVSYRLAEAGFHILRPISEALPFDLAVYVDSRFVRIQVKRARKCKDSERFQFDVLKVVSRQRDGSIKKYRYDDSMVDVIAAVVTEADAIYFFPIEALEPIKERIQLDPYHLSKFRSSKSVVDTTRYLNVWDVNGYRINLESKAVRDRTRLEADGSP